MFNLLGESPDFFAVRRSSRWDIVLFALIVVLAPPALLVAVEALAGLVSRSAQRLLHVVFVDAAVAAITRGTSSRCSAATTGSMSWKVFISSEAPLPEDLAAYELKGPVEDIHHLLAHARMIVGESATMSSDAAVLGVPAVMIATTGCDYTDDQERRYGHVRHFVEDDYDQAVAAVEELFAWNPRERGQQARERLLEDKIDVTRWMVDYFESTLSGSS